MAFDFPSSPTVGQKYPASPIGGVPTYTWDGEKWTTIGGATGVGSAVCYDIAQALTLAQQQQARQNIYAAPFGAMAYNGLQINGGMEVSQELSGTAKATSGYVCDGWRIGFGGTMALRGIADGSGGIFPLFPYRLAVLVDTAQASLGAGDYTQIQQYIEGWRCVRLLWGTANAQPLTIGFWTAHHRTGVYSLVVRNGTDNRTYGASYTQNVADIAQYNIVTVPGDTGGTWAVDNTIGLKIAFSFGCGSTFTAPSINAWLAGNYIAAPGQINAVAATSDVFRLTGVIVLPGNEAPFAARSPFVMRPYDQELIVCKRYFQKVSFPTSQYAATLMAYSTSSCYGPFVQFGTEMRVAPGPAHFLPTDYQLQGAGGGGITPSTVTVATTPLSACLAPINIATASFVAGQAIQLIALANAYTLFDARL